MRIALLFLAVITLLSHADSRAEDFSILLGSGPQAGSDQRNEIVGFEYAFFTLERSARQHLQVGISYSRYRTNTGMPNELRAISVYPQLSFYPGSDSKIARSMHARVQPFFFMRMLGPTYISGTTLGAREQAKKFTFHAQIGAGFEVELNSGQHILTHVSWRHLSNADLFSPNDGIDVPLVLTIGIRY